MRRCAMQPERVMKSLATTFLIFLTCIVVAGTISLIDRAETTLSASGSTVQACTNAADARNGATLAEFAVSAQEKLRLAPPSYPVVFDDLRPNDPGYAAAQAVYPFLHRQLLCPECALDSSFSSKDALTRAQAAVVLVSILTAQERINLLTPEQSAGVLENVPDADAVSALAQPYIATALADGVLSLDSDNMIRPTQPYSRIEMAAAFDTIQRRFPPSAATASLRVASEAAR
jgi:S-layer homology domain